MIPKKILLSLEMRIQVRMKLEKLMKWTVFLQVRPDVVQKTQLIAPPIQELTEKHLLLKE